MFSVADFLDGESKSHLPPRFSRWSECVGGCFHAPPLRKALKRQTKNPAPMVPGFLQPTSMVEFDPYGRRFFSSWGSGTVHVYDLAETPERRSLPLLDRTFWAHDGTFLPDRSLVTGRNGIGTGPVAHWKTSTPVAWSLDLSGRVGWPSVSSDGRVLYLWELSGEVTGMPLVRGKVEGIGSLGQTRGWAYGAGVALITDNEPGRTTPRFKPSPHS